MQTRRFMKNHSGFAREAAGLLIESFPHCYSDCAEEEVMNCLSDERIAFMAVEGNQLVGFAGAVPQYVVTGWELHPLVVRKSHQYRGIGTLLIKATELESQTYGWQKGFEVPKGLMRFGHCIVKTELRK